MTVAVSFVISWHLVENCQYFGRIRFLFLYVFTVPSQDHNLINHHEKVKYFVPVLTVPGAWHPMFPQLWPPLRLLPCPQWGTNFVYYIWTGLLAKCKQSIRSQQYQLLFLLVY